MFFEQYFSLSNAQNIQAYLNVNGTVFITKALLAERTVVRGLIKADT